MNEDEEYCDYCGAELADKNAGCEHCAAEVVKDIQFDIDCAQGRI